MKPVSLSATLAITLSLAACSNARLPSAPRIPFVHHVDVQQGNVITQEMIAQLELGMDKKKVGFLMGTPIIQDTFHRDRWDYLYTNQPGGGAVERRRITLIFKEDKLAGVEGDIKPASGSLVVDTRQDTTIDVPGEYQPGIFSKLKSKMPFTGGKDEDKQDTAKTDGKGPATTGTEKPASKTASSEEVTVPSDVKPKKKGFFKRIFGRDEDSPGAPLPTAASTTTPVDSDSQPKPQ